MRIQFRGGLIQGTMTPVVQKLHIQIKMALWTFAPVPGAPNREGIHWRVTSTSADLPETPS